MGTIINEGAVIDKDSIIGENCLIGCHAVIRPRVKIGDNTVIAHHVVVESDVEIGKNTTVQVFAAFASNTKIGDNCFIGPYFSPTNCFEQPTGPKGRHPDKIKGKLEYQEIGNDVVIGSNCSVAPGITIGDNVDVGMNTFIKADIPSGESPSKPFRIRGGSVWTKKDLAYYMEKENKKLFNNYKEIIED